MKLQKLLLVALAGVAMLVSSAAAQAPKPAAAAPAGQAPGAKPRLAAPVRGVAQLGYTKPVVKRGTIGGKPFIITTIQVKNLAAGAIAGLKVDEFWYDKAGEPVTGAQPFRYRKALMPGEVIDVVLKVPTNPKMDRNQYKFEHSNGTIKTKLLPKL